MYNLSELQETKVPQLFKVIKAEGVPYKVYSKMKKAELIDHLMNETLEREASAPTLTHDDVDKQIKEFIAQGGQIKKGPSPRDPKVSAPTQKSAISSMKPKKKRSKKSLGLFDDPEDAIIQEVNSSKKNSPRKKSAKKKPESPRQNDSVVTLQELLEKAGVSGYEARKILRKSDIEKPGKQWVWEKGHKDIKKVEKLLKSAK